MTDERHVWLVEGTHWSVPGRQTKVCATEAEAHEQAAALVFLLLISERRARVPATDVTALNWRVWMEGLQQRHDGCGVSIARLPLLGVAENGQ